MKREDGSTVLGSDKVYLPLLGIPQQRGENPRHHET